MPTGKPMTFDCSACRLKYDVHRRVINGRESTGVSRAPVAHHRQHRTGVEKTRRSTHRGRLTGRPKRCVQYVCTCGHTGFSTHPGALALPLKKELPDG